LNENSELRTVELSLTGLRHCPGHQRRQGIPAIAASPQISTEPVYETAALVEVNEVANFLEEQGSPQIDWNAPTIKEETNLLRSRRVLSPVVERFGLRVNVEANRVPVLSALTQRIAPLGNWISSFDMARTYAWQQTIIEITHSGRRSGFVPTDHQRQNFAGATRC